MTTAVFNPTIYFVGAPRVVTAAPSSFPHVRVVMPSTQVTTADGGVLSKIHLERGPNGSILICNVKPEDIVDRRIQIHVASDLSESHPTYLDPATPIHHHIQITHYPKDGPKIHVKILNIPNGNASQPSGLKFLSVIHGANHVAGSPWCIAKDGITPSCYPVGPHALILPKGLAPISANWPQYIKPGINKFLISNVHPTDKSLHVKIHSGGKEINVQVKKTAQPTTRRVSFDVPHSPSAIVGILTHKIIVSSGNNHIEGSPFIVKSKTENESASGFRGMTQTEGENAAGVRGLKLADNENEADLRGQTRTASEVGLCNRQELDAKKVDVHMFDSAPGHIYILNARSPNLVKITFDPDCENQGGLVTGNVMDCKYTPQSKNTKIVVKYGGFEVFNGTIPATVPIETSRCGCDKSCSCSCTVDCPKFAVGGKIDCKDTYKVWYRSTILDKTDDNVLVHYDGWSSSWDEWLSKTSERIAPLGTHSSKPTRMSAQPQFNSHILHVVNIPKLIDTSQLRVFVHSTRQVHVSSSLVSPNESSAHQITQIGPGTVKIKLAKQNDGQEHHVTVTDLSSGQRAQTTVGKLGPIVNALLARLRAGAGFGDPNTTTFTAPPSVIYGESQPAATMGYGTQMTLPQIVTPRHLAAENVGGNDD